MHVHITLETMNEKEGNLTTEKPSELKPEH